MQFKCSRIKMDEVVSCMAGIVSDLGGQIGKGIEDCSIHITAKEGNLNLRVMDSVMGCEAVLPAKIEEEGEMDIYGPLFIGIIQGMRDKKMGVLSTPKGILIRGRKGKFKVRGLAIERVFPGPKLQEDFLVLNASEVVKGIKQVLGIQLLTQEKPMLACIYCEIKDGNLRLVATDGFRLGISDIPIETENGTPFEGVPLSSRFIKEWLKTLTSLPLKTIKVGVSKGRFVVDCDDVLLYATPLAGQYAKYENALQPVHETTVRVEKSELLDLLGRAKLFSSKAKMSFREGLLLLESSSVSGKEQVGASSEDIEVHIEGSELSVGVMPDRFLDGVSRIDENKIELKFNSSLTPILIQGEEDDSYRYILMPIRI